MKRALLITPAVVPYDAVSNDVRMQHAALAEHLPTYIYCDHYTEDGYSAPYLIEKKDLNSFLQDPDTILLYHHSIYWQDLSLLFDTKARLFIKYHNITPPSFFAPYSPIYYEATKKGLAQLQDLVNLPAVFLADSAFNACDIPQARILPPFTILNDFDRPIDLDFAKTILSHRPNILFVGRFAPNKGHVHLLKTLFLLKKLSMDPILHIAGGHDPNLRAYNDRIQKLIDYYDLRANVRIYDKLPFAKLLALYKSCDLFLLLSEHEGFCVPILEAQYCSLPIVAVDRGAIGETAGKGAVVLKDYDYLTIAKNVVRLFDDPIVTLEIVKKGKENLRRFSSDAIRKNFLNILNI